MNFIAGKLPRMWVSLAQVVWIPAALGMSGGTSGTDRQDRYVVVTPQTAKQQAPQGNKIKARSCVIDLFRDESFEVMPVAPGQGEFLAAIHNDDILAGVPRPKFLHM